MSKKWHKTLSRQDVVLKVMQGCPTTGRHGMRYEFCAHPDCLIEVCEKCAMKVDKIGWWCALHAPKEGSGVNAKEKRAHRVLIRLGGMCRREPKKGEEPWIWWCSASGCFRRVCPACGTKTNDHVEGRRRWYWCWEHAAEGKH